MNPASAGFPRHYTASDLEKALADCGVAPGDILFSHVSMGMLGFPEAGETESAMFKTIVDAVLAVLGPTGTWLVPTYTYSLCRGETYDPDKTPSTIGPFTESFRKLPGAVRSLEPIFSVAGIGAQAPTLLADLPWDCFGRGCVYERLSERGAKVCNIGVGLRTITMAHWFEQRETVPYRFLKPFAGLVMREGRPEPQRWLYNVCVRQDNCAPDLHALERLAAEAGFVRKAKVGLGEITVFPVADIARLAAEGIARDRWFLAAGPPSDLVEAEGRRLGDAPAAVSLPAGPGPIDLVRGLSSLPAYPLSAACDATLAALGRGLPMTTTAIPSGTRVGCEVVQERWVCRSASLETADGKPLLSLASQPLLVPYYSAAFDGLVSREALLERLHTHPDPEAVPLASLLHQQAWGLCCSQRLKDGLTHPSYRVRIDAAFGYGAMKVGHARLCGLSDETVVLLAGPDHCGMANDGLAGAVVACEAFRQALGRGVPRFSIDLLLAPRPLGAASFLRSGPGHASRIKGIVLLESQGIDDRLTVQSPTGFDGPFERRCAAAANRCEEGALAAAGDGPWLSGEDLAGGLLPFPTVCLCRAPQPLDLARPYDGFRSSIEAPAMVSPAALAKSIAALLRFIDEL